MVGGSHHSQNGPVAELRRGFVLGQWVKILFFALREAGVEDIIISPGSRSTPLVIAALSQSGVRCHSVIDERSAGFFALGLARATGKAPLLLCTSGSALSHYFPALIEAHESEIPLLILSADRPSELMECGAPQTIRQEGIFGHFAKSAPFLGEASADLDKVRAMLRKVFQAVDLTTSPSTGPVHLNFPVAKPLTPLSAEGKSELAWEREVAQLCASSRPRPPAGALVVESRVRAHFLEVMAGLAPLVMTLGPIGHREAQSARKLAQSLGIPCLSELPQAGPASPLDLLASIFPLEHLKLPLHVLHIGPPCISDTWNHLLKSEAVELHILPGERYRDPSNQAKTILPGSLFSLLNQLRADLAYGSLTPKAADSSQIRIENECLTLTTKTRKELRELKPTLAGVIPEARAVACVLEQLSGEHHLCIGNSLTLRLACWVAPSHGSRVGPLFTARGANGIDGWIAASAGTAAATQKPCVALIGDVTASHDLGSLSLLARIESALVVIILDNSGGRIFDHLPAHDQLGNDDAWKFWRTPVDLDWQNAAKAFALPYARCETEEELTNALTDFLSRPTASLLHVITDPSATRGFVAKLRGNQGA